jgi:hypothetical protein
MSHKRTQIRQAFKALLETIPSLSASVMTTRMTPVPQANLPAYLIYAMEEDIRLDGTPHAQLRELTLNAELLFSGTDSLDDIADVYALDVEKIVATDRTLGGLAYDTVLTATKLGTWLDGEKRNGSITLTYTVFYRTSVANPEITNP